MSRFVTSALICALFLAVPAVTLAHEDDGKTRDRIPPYRGPGWRAATGSGGNPAGGPAGGGGGNGPDFPASGVQLLAWITLPEFGPNNNNGNSCWGYVSPSGREYAIMGMYIGTGFVEITNPGDPQILAVVPTPAGGSSNLWRDMKTYQHYCYAVSEVGGGIQVMDIGDIDNGVVTNLAAVTTGPAPGATHSLSLNEASGYLYRNGGGSNGLRIYSLANPAVPAYVAAWTDRYVHECQVINYTEGPYAGKEVAFCCSGFNGGFNDTGLDILDVTNKQNIINMYPPRVHWSNAGYSHQIWVSPDRHYAYLDDELDESNFGLNTRTIIIDISDLNNPFVAGEFYNDSTAIGHNLYVKGNLIFEANYRSGLRIFDATNPLAPVEIGYFDTWPQDDGANFNGLWNNWPFFPSGTVIGSDIEKGLFIWQVGAAQIAFAHPNGLPQYLNPLGDSIVVQITPQNGGAIQPGSPKFKYDAGDGLVTADLTPLGGDLYAAVFPPLPCGREISYHFTVQTVAGVTVNDPSSAPLNTFSAIAASGSTINFHDDMEANTGWTAGAPGDNATTGVWVRVDPNPTIAQPGDDNPAGTGTLCWITGQGPVGGGDGDADVDAGVTTLTSPTLDATVGANAAIVYYRWYSNNLGGAPNSDSMPISISNNNGASWVLLEDVTENTGAWTAKTFPIADFVTPTNQIKVRFVARDLGAGSLVEAGVDDVQIVSYECGIAGDIDGDGDLDSVDAGLFSNVMLGTPADAVHVIRSNLNGDTTADGGDIQDFVSALLGN